MNHLERRAEHLHRPGAAPEIRRVSSTSRRCMRRGHGASSSACTWQGSSRTRPWASLTVAKQQMVEIAKALSYDSRVLIMDEPTAALNTEKVSDLFRHHRPVAVLQGVAIVYISHKMDELKRIADRVTVMRDGQYIATVRMADTAMDSLIAMMVGRHLADVENDFPDTSQNEIVLEVKGIHRGAMVRDASFVLRKGEILGFAGLMGAGRTELARAVFGADPIDSGEVWLHGRK